MLTRRELLLGSAGLAAASAGVTPARAQGNFPSRPVRIIVANPPGGDDDTLTRFIAQAIQADLGQLVVVDNRGGASTTIGGLAAAQAAPDGYTLLCVHMASIIQTVLRERLAYNMASFAPIIGIGGYPMALVVSPRSEIRTLADLRAAATRGDGLTFASGGVGTLGHLTSIRFLSAIGGRGVHVPYGNNPQGLQALAGGFTEMMFSSVREAAQLAREGHVRVLAVTSKERSSNLPDTPTMTELGLPQIDARLWYSYVAPAGTPPAVVARLGDAIEKAVTSPAFGERFHPASFQTEILRGEPLVQFINTQASRFRQLIVENNIRITD
ncbi:MAG: tripartite tricarboxylate transporter substrate binding protein [Elioraea sp.]|nr:tripartite tricarboxylate transporter substrate binding protein [Elioraea sp.]